MSEPILNEVFLLPEEGGSYLLYGPLVGLLARVNASAAHQLHCYLKTQDQSDVSPEVAAAIGGLDRLERGKAPSPIDKDRAFSPESLTIFPTNRCNLRCVYCYASAGSWQPRNIDKAFCETAIDLLAENSKRSAKKMSINFHGGGEPTQNWQTIVHCVDYSRRRIGNDVRFSMATNGILSRNQIDYLAENFGSVNLSLDGPKDIHDIHRPMADGSSCFEYVMKTIDELRHRNMNFSIRATVTTESVNRMLEITKFLIQDTGCRVFALEPVFACGRCDSSGYHTPDPELFAKGFIQSYEYGRCHNVEVRYSGARPGPATNSFCGVCRDSFSITPDGCVTSCFEVCQNNHPLASTFIYGHYNSETNRIEIDQDHLRRLRELVVTNRRYCDGCFCRWHCAGDCQVKVKSMEMGNGFSPERCRMNQAITLYMLSSLINTNHGKIGLPSSSKGDPSCRTTVR